MLNSMGINLILGMSWLAEHDAVIQCAKRTVQLTTESGERVKYQSTTTWESCQANQAKSATMEDIRVVKEFPHVFP